MEMQHKTERQLSEIEKLPLHLSLLIISFLFDLKAIKNFGLTCKKNSLITKFFLENPECFMSEHFSLDRLQVLIKKLDEKKALKEQISLAQARKELKSELDLLTALHSATHR